MTSSGICAFLNGAGLRRESGRKVRRGSPLNRCSASFVLVGLMGLRMVLALAFFVLSGKEVQIAMPAIVVRDPMSVILMRGFGQACESILILGSSEV